MKKRILALLLCLILTATVCAVPAFAENTVTVEEAVQSILNDMSNTDDSCTNASQQAANGAYSLAEMLHLGAMMKAENEQQSDMLNSILDGMYTTDKSTTDAEQQLANGAYGISSLLIAIATMMDEEGNFGEDIRRISEECDNYDTSAANAAQQAYNGLDASVKLLAVIAAESCIEPADEFDKPIYEGRFNCGALSLHFPMIVAKAKAEGKDFFDVLEYYLQLCRKIHIRTLDFLSHKKAGINPLAFCEGGFYNGNKKPDEEIGRDFLKPATVSFGITALNEATVMYNGKTIYEDNSEFADKVLQYINDFANKYKKEDGILYAIYGTPAESLCFCSGTIVQCYNGNKEIQNIKAGDLVYSYNENLNKIELKPVVASSCTSQTAKVVKIHFTNGQELVCTPNHPFAVRKKDVYNHREVIRYIAAKDLTRGLRIKSNYIRLVHGRHRFTTQQYEHDIVAEYFYGKKPAGYIVHHIDENKLNNQKENLVYMSDADHRILHMKDTILPYCYTSKSQKGANNTFYGKHHTSKSIQLNREKHLGKNNVCSKEVAQYTLDDVLINIFESRSIAEASTGFKNISNACNGISTNAKGNHVAYNFKWYYTKDIKNFACENHVVESVEFLEDRIPVYNIEVADNHNYFVGGDNGVLVHNCALQVQQFRKKYGIIKGVSDREYTTNSFHMHVTEDISPIEKQDAEYKCFHKCNGGNIMYNRFTSEYNKKAYIDLIRRAMRLGYYYGCNKQQNFCEHCGAEFIDAQKCPKCGSEDITQIDRVCGYLGYTRIKGYSMMNSGKVAEIRDRKSM